MRDFRGLLYKYGSYAGPSTKTLIEKANDLGLAGSETIRDFTPEQIEEAYNGIGSSDMPDWLRNALTRQWAYYAPAAFIHDLQFAKGGTKKDWEKANENLYNNLNTLVEEATDNNAIKYWRRKKMALLAKYLMDKYSLKAFNLKGNEAAA